MGAPSSRSTTQGFTPSEVEGEDKGRTKAIWTPSPRKGSLVLMENNNLKERLKDLKKNPNVPYAYIPKPIVVLDEPKFSRFPFCILFASYRMHEGRLQSGAAFYHPDLSSYRETDSGFTMFYRNRDGWSGDAADSKNDWRVVVGWSAKENHWVGLKFRGTEAVQSEEGSDWEEFFIRFTALGLADGEMCEFSDVESVVHEAETKEERLLGFQV